MFQFEQKLKAAIKKKELGEREFVKQMGWKKESSYYALLQTEKPRMATMRKLCKVLGVTMSYWDASEPIDVTDPGTSSEIENLKSELQKKSLEILYLNEKLNQKEDLIKVLASANQSLVLRIPVAAQAEDAPLKTKRG